MWHSGDEDGLQSQVSAKKKKNVKIWGGGARFRDSVRGAIGLGIGIRRQ